MFEDLIRENGKLKKDCPYCSSVVVINYELFTYRNKGLIWAHSQISYCMKCNKRWDIKYDDKMNILEIKDYYV